MVITNALCPLYSVFIHNETKHRIKVAVKYVGELRVFEYEVVIPVNEVREFAEETYPFKGIDKRFIISEITVESYRPREDLKKLVIKTQDWVKQPTKNCTFVIQEQEKKQTSNLPVENKNNVPAIPPLLFIPGPRKYVVKYQGTPPAQSPAANI